MSEAANASPIGDLPAVCIDFKNPKSYLALQPTFALEDELGTTFDWWPMQVSAMSRPQREQPNEDRGTRHRRIRAVYYERDLRRYASAYGLELGDLYRNPDVAMASVGLLWVKQHAPQALRAYLKTVFERYWQQRLQLDDADAIDAVLRAIGVTAPHFRKHAQNEGRVAYEAAVAGLRGAGIFDVPAYVIEGEIYFGRQHLPMVRWLLTGKRGEPPI